MLECLNGLKLGFGSSVASYGPSQLSEKQGCIQFGMMYHARHNMIEAEFTHDC